MQSTSKGKASSEKKSSKKPTAKKRNSLAGVDVSLTKPSVDLEEDDERVNSVSIDQSSTVLLDSEVSKADASTAVNRSMDLHSSSSSSAEHFYDVNLKDYKMRELNGSSDSAEKESAADRILAVKKSLKKIAIFDPYGSLGQSKEIEQRYKEDHEEEEEDGQMMTAEDIQLMDSTPFAYRTYEELVELNKAKSYTGLVQKKLEAYLTDEDFQIVFRKDRVRAFFL